MQHRRWTIALALASLVIAPRRAASQPSAPEGGPPCAVTLKLPADLEKQHKTTVTNEVEKRFTLVTDEAEADLLLNLELRPGQCHYVVERARNECTATAELHVTDQFDRRRDVKNTRQGFGVPDTVAQGVAKANAIGGAWLGDSLEAIRRRHAHGLVLDGLPPKGTATLVGAVRGRHVRGTFRCLTQGEFEAEVKDSAGHLTGKLSVRAASPPTVTPLEPSTDGGSSSSSSTSTSTSSSSGGGCSRGEWGGGGLLVGALLLAAYFGKRASLPGWVTRYLTPPQLVEVRDAALRRGLDRNVLLGDLPADFVSDLPLRGNPKQQMDSDLTSLNRLGPLPPPNGPVPLVIWLEKAASLTKSYPEHAVFTNALRVVVEGLARSAEEASARGGGDSGPRST